MTEEKTGAERLAERLAAIASPQRMRIITELVGQPRYVSELARRVGMSRALLYMHLRKLEEAGFVVGHLELGEDGKAVNIFESVPFSISINPDVIASAVNSTNERKE